MKLLFRTRGQLLTRPVQHLTTQRRSCAGIAVCLLVLLPAQGCKESPNASAGKTLTLIDQSWSDKGSQQRLKEALQTFTHRTGIRVEVLPAPEAAVEQLTTWRRLLESGASVPDVYGIDVIWPGILANELLDLRMYVPAHEIAAHFPELIANNTVNGKMVALPYTMAAGVLFYRVDLLQKYSYRAPPKTWNELEAMAARIQSGERARGNAEFWGYVWQGAPSEALTCNALEWQASEGGGTLIENGTVSADNPHAVRAWERAARWIGSISPPGVVAYKEWDALNLWQAGQAAFMRAWSVAYIIVRAPGSPTRDTFQVAPLPAGRNGSAATLGATGYGISRHSHHPREAAMLVRYLCSRDEQRRRCLTAGTPPSMPDLYSDPEVTAANPYFSTDLHVFRTGLASRPSTATGKLYPEVSRAYFEAVHAVLTRKTAAAQAANALQRHLVQITGLKASASATSTP
jgi:trehalose/maltose transport system substrate-binding protein